MTPNSKILLEWQGATELQPVELTDHDVHLWWVPLTLSDQQTESARALLNESQLEKYQRRYSNKGQQRYLAGRYYLYRLLAAYTQIDACDLAVEYGAHGKPYLNTEQTPLKYNYTDTRGYGLFAFARNCELGVDVESFGRTGKFTKIADQRFSENEIQYVTNGDGEIDPHKFLAYWTRKEAYGKALGVGINFAMRDIDMHSAEKPSLRLNNPDLSLYQIELPNSFVGCLVYQGHQTMSLSAFTVSS